MVISLEQPSHFAVIQKDGSPLLCDAIYYFGAGFFFLRHNTLFMYSICV